MRAVDVVAIAVAVVASMRTLPLAFWSRPQAYYDSAGWRGTWEFDGGAFMNQASHYVDLLDWICGPVESVMAYTGTLARNIEVEDTGVAALKVPLEVETGVGANWDQAH